MTPIHRLHALLTAAALSFGGLAVHALPVITGVQVLETSAPNEPPPRFTGQTFNHPNEGANFTVGRFIEDATAFVDRLHEWNGASTSLPIPRYLLNQEYIMFGNDNRDNNPFQVEVTISADSDVYLLIDNRHPDGNNATPPNIESTMLWVTEGGWVPVQNGLNRRNNPDEPDEVGVDEGGDGVGPGVGLNQWSSVYVRRVQAGTFIVGEPENAGRNMYGVVVRPVPQAPYVSSSSGDFLGVTFEITDGARSALAPGSVQLRVDGADVTAEAQITRSGDVTRIRYRRTTPFPSLSAHTAVLTFNDTATPPATISDTLNWTAEYYATLTVADSVPAADVDTASSGFTARVVQARDTAVWPGADLPNSTLRAELQLAGLLRDPITGGPLANFAIPGPGPRGTYSAERINWNQQLNEGGGGFEVGNFQTGSNPSFPDQPIPGIPGTDPDSQFNSDNIAAELITYLELTAGLHRLGVNSDDGFRVTAGRDPANPANVLLGVFEGGRGAADTLFHVLVEQDGIYPVRLVWYEGGGDANLEFFSVRQPTPDDPIQRIPINSRAEANALRSYARAAVPQAPAASVYPLARAVNVPAGAPIRAALLPRTAEANPGSVQLTVNGTPVVITTSAGQAGLVVEHVRDTLWPSASVNTAVLTYADTAGNQATVTWQFTVENYENLPVVSAGFAAAPGLVNTASSGFIVDMYQMDDSSGLPLARTGFADANSPEAAEHQINRRFLAPGTGQPWPNFATPGENPDGTHNVELVNWNQQFGNAGDFNAGNGFEDAIVPGIFEPGDNAFNNWIVAESVAWLELKKGRHRFGVNSDDGFRVTTGANPRDAVGVQLGVFPTGRGAGNTFFDFIVEADGIYPFRLLWWEGTGGASVEFKSQDVVSGAQTLINDRTRADGVRAYRLLTGPAPARIAAVSPVPGNTDVLPNDPVSVTFENLGAAPAQLFINGQEVAVQRTTSGNLTTLTHQPVTPFTPGSTVTARAVRGGSASTWSFTIRNAPTVAITAPADGQIFATSPANVTVVATASIVGASITLVEFFDGAGTKLGEDASAPYELALPGLEGGRYTVVARATDSRGLSGTSAPVRFRVGEPTVAINFQDATSEGFPGYLPDLGQVYNDRGNGYSYGWAEDIQAQARNRNNAQFSPDERYDTFNHSARPTNSNQWEIGLPNGSYYVYTVAGEPSNFDSVYHVQAEGVTTVQGTPTATVRFFEGGAVVTVADGRLTLTNGPGSSNNKIAFVEIYARSGGAPAPVLSATLAGGNLTVTWVGGGTLESAPAVNGPYTSTGNSSGTYTEAATAGAKYFRVVR